MEVFVWLKLLYIIMIPIEWKYTIEEKMRQCLIIQMVH